MVDTEKPQVWIQTRKRTRPRHLTRNAPRKPLRKRNQLQAHRSRRAARWMTSRRSQPLRAWEPPGCLHCLRKRSVGDIVDGSRKMSRGWVAESGLHYCGASCKGICFVLHVNQTRCGIVTRTSLSQFIPSLPPTRHPPPCSRPVLVARSDESASDGSSCSAQRAWRQPPLLGRSTKKSGRLSGCPPRRTRRSPRP